MRSWLCHNLILGDGSCVDPFMPHASLYASAQQPAATMSSSEPDIRSNRCALCWHRRLNHLKSAFRLSRFSASSAQLFDPIVKAPDVFDFFQGRWDCPKKEPNAEEEEKICNRLR